MRVGDINPVSCDSDLVDEKNIPIPPHPPPSQKKRLDWCGAPRQLQLCVWQGEGSWVIWAAPRVHGFTYIKSPTRP